MKKYMFWLLAQVKNYEGVQDMAQERPASHM
jgi:hypothetical protein